MFITYSSFYPSHKYFVFIITCQVPYNGLLYADEQNLVPTSKNSQANERNTRKMKFLWMVAELHKKESILETQISPFIQSHETLECYYKRQHPSALSPNPNTPFHSTSTHLSSKTMAPISNIHVQSSDVIPDHKLHVSEMQSSDSYLHSLAQALPCHSKSTFASPPFPQSSKS